MSALSRRGYGNGEGQVKENCVGGQLGCLGEKLSQYGIVQSFAVEVGDVLHECHDQRMGMAFAR